MTRARQDLLKSGELLRENEYLVSLNNKYCACLHVDGNLVVYRGPTPGSGPTVWHRGVHDEDLGAKCAYLWKDGVVCIYKGEEVDATKQIDSFGTSISDTSEPDKPKCLCLHDDGNLSIYNSDTPGDTQIWSSGFQDRIFGKAIDYCIIVYTNDVTDAGTSNKVNMTMETAIGKKVDLVLEGSQDRKGRDVTIVHHEDIGIITGITLDVGGWPDKWFPYSIEILRDTNKDQIETADGWTEFIIDKELGDDPENFAPTTIRKPNITIGPSGEPVEHTERITLVQFDHNPGQASQTVMKYKETWGSYERVQISKEETETIGVGAKVTYESPESEIYGKFGIEVSASWESTVTNIREEATEEFNQREFDWSFEADPKSYVFRLQVFRVPYADQIYKDNAGHSRAIRKLKSEIIPAGVGDFLFIPRIEEGKIVPVLMRELEDDWFAYMEEKNVTWIEHRHLRKWRAKGWVVDEESVIPTEKKARVLNPLHIRDNHNADAKILGHLKEEDEVTVIDTWTQGDNTWVKLKPTSRLPKPEDQWSAMLIRGNRYLIFEDDIKG